MFFDDGFRRKRSYNNLKCRLEAKGEKYDIPGYLYQFAHLELHQEVDES